MKQTVAVYVLLLNVLLVSSKPNPNGIIRDLGVPLPSNEKIYKRSVDNLPATELSTTVETPTEEPTESDGDSTEDDLMLIPPSLETVWFVESIEDAGAESGLVFRPLFVYRNRQVRRSRVGRSTRSVDDLEGAESSIVFRPLFRYRYTQKRRAERRRLQ